MLFGYLDTVHKNQTLRDYEEGLEISVTSDDTAQDCDPLQDPTQIGRRIAEGFKMIAGED